MTVRQNYNKLMEESELHLMVISLSCMNCNQPRSNFQLSYKEKMKKTFTFVLQLTLPT